jgi:hypothetical protein
MKVHRLVIGKESQSKRTDRYRLQQYEGESQSWMKKRRRTRRRTTTTTTSTVKEIVFENVTVNANATHTAAVVVDGDLEKAAEVVLAMMTMMVEPVEEEAAVAVVVEVVPLLPVRVAAAHRVELEIHLVGERPIVLKGGCHHRLIDFSSNNSNSSKMPLRNRQG